MRDAFVEQLLTAARQDPRIMLMVGDLGFGVVDSFARDLPSQFLNAGVAEQNMVGMAAGLASTGYKVFVYSIANFPTLRALEQIRNDVCYHGYDVNIVSVGAGLAYGTLGYTHHAIEDLSAMRALPGMRVLSPADPSEARLSLQFALESAGPTYIRLGKNGEPDLASVQSSKLGEPRVLRQGTDAVILVTGAIAGECLAAAHLLSDDGISATVASCPLVNPAPTEWLARLPNDVPVITVEEHVLNGGFGSAILEAMNDLSLQARVLRLGLSPDQLGAIGSQSYLRKLHGLGAQEIRADVLRFMSEPRP